MMLCLKTNVYGVSRVIVSVIGAAVDTSTHLTLDYATTFT